VFCNFFQVQTPCRTEIGEGLTVQKRWGYPDDVGKAVSALALANFPYSTGQVIMIDGGITLSRF